MHYMPSHMRYNFVQQFCKKKGYHSLNIRDLKKVKFIPVKQIAHRAASINPNVFINKKIILEQKKKKKHGKLLHLLLRAFLISYTRQILVNNQCALEIVNFIKKTKI